MRALQVFRPQGQRLFASPCRRVLVRRLRSAAAQAPRLLSGRHGWPPGFLWFGGHHSLLAWFAHARVLASFVDAIFVRASPLLPAPKPRRRRKELPANFTPRRSFHIAKADLGLSSEMKAKRVLLRCLGLIANDDSPISNKVLEKYALLFEQPLTLDVLEAFANFFGWQLPSTLPTTCCAPPSQPLLAEA